MSTQLDFQTIFYSWQSDLPNRTNRTFIQDALQRAIDGILGTELEVDLILDRDTMNTPGAPDIAQTILAKIDRAIAIVADVSIINAGSGGRPMPNPNVLFELGYAVHSLTWNNVLPVFNLATGRIEDLPFDLRSRRPITYTMTENVGDRAAELRSLSRTLQAALELIIRNQRARAVEGPRLSLDARVTRPGRREIFLMIRNEGNGMARAPYLSFRIPTDFRMLPHGIDGSGTHGFLGAPHGGSDYRNPRFGGRADVIIHPHTTVDVAQIIFNGRPDAVPEGNLTIEYELRAEGSPNITSMLTINEQEEVM